MELYITRELSPVGIVEWKGKDNTVGSKYNFLQGQEKTEEPKISVNHFSPKYFVSIVKFLWIQ